MDYFDSFNTKGGVNPIQGFLIKEAHLNNVMVTWVEMKPGSLLPEHKHDHEQITLVLEGKLELTVGDKTRLMSRGDVAVVPSNVPHHGRVLDELTVAIDAWNPIREDYLYKK